MSSFYTILKSSASLRHYGSVFESARVTAEAILENPTRATAGIRYMLADLPPIVTTAASVHPCPGLIDRIAFHAPKLYLLLFQQVNNEHPNEANVHDHVITLITELQETLSSCNSDAEFVDFAMSMLDCANDVAERFAPVFRALVDTQPIIDTSFSFDLEPSSLYALQLARGLNKRQEGYRMLKPLVGVDGAFVRTIETAPEWRCETALIKAYPDCSAKVAEYIVGVCCRLDAERGVASSREEWSFARRVHFACPEALLYVLENTAEEIAEIYASFEIDGLVDDVIGSGPDDAARRLAAGVIAALVLTLEAMREGRLERSASFEERIAVLMPSVSLESNVEEILDLLDSGLSIEEIADISGTSTNDACLFIGVARSQKAMATDLDTDELCAVVSLWAGLGCVLPGVMDLLIKYRSDDEGCAAGCVANADTFRKDFVALYPQAKKNDAERHVWRLLEVARALAPRPLVAAATTSPLSSGDGVPSDNNEVTNTNGDVAAPGPMSRLSSGLIGRIVTEDSTLQSVGARLAAAATLSDHDAAAVHEFIKSKYPNFPSGASPQVRGVVIAIRNDINRLTAIHQSSKSGTATTADVASMDLTTLGAIEDSIKEIHGVLSDTLETQVEKALQVLFPKFPTGASPAEKKRIVAIRARFPSKE
ncbi:Hypothetical protein, putative [Bodo saltans]|uniref:Uncharacterized protein n=1 Tax=Bodo saltans TaxID=75058 RepID=A0A0S4JBU5_BODSA|nr:Hypothetical protein, putative [Bodo saltans]|eukprot:CUG87857.1 Hypothetical protein, putative [Bodo saltans]